MIDTTRHQLPAPRVNGAPGGRPADSDTVLGKAQLILEAFGPGDEGASLTCLVRRTGLPKASVHRICQDLVAWGLLERTGNGYRLGIRLFELGQLVQRTRELRDVAMPFLEDLARDTGETVHCAVLDGRDVLYVEKLGGYRPVSRPSRTGGRMPPHCTATGKALLAFSGTRMIRQVLAGPLPRLTSHTITSSRRLEAELAQIRAARIATESEECRIGYLAVAAPVFGPGGVIAGAVSVAAPTASATPARFTSPVGAAAARISRRLAASRARPRPT